jgi:hypothetical protein
MRHIYAHGAAGVSNLLFSSGVAVSVFLGGTVANAPAAAVAVAGMAYVGIENLRATVHSVREP